MAVKKCANIRCSNTFEQIDTFNEKLYCSRKCKEKQAQYLRVVRRGKNYGRVSCQRCSKQYLKKTHRQDFCGKKCRDAHKGEYLSAIKSNSGCADCGLMLPDYPEVFDFHHISNKKFTLSKYTQHTIGSIQREVAKCVVLCSNCHRIRHAKERRGVLRKVS